MSDNVIIRELFGIDQIMAIFPLYGQVSQLGETAFRQRLLVMLARNSYRCFAAYIGEHLVGTSGFWIGTQLWCGKYSEADDVVVDNAFRSRGIGGKLMAWIERKGSDPNVQWPASPWCWARSAHTAST